MDDRWFRLGDHGRYPDQSIHPRILMSQAFTAVDWNEFLRLYENSDTLDECPPYQYLEAASFSDGYKTLGEICEPCRLPIWFAGDDDYEAGRSVSGEVAYLRGRISADIYLDLFEIASIFYPNFMSDVILRDSRVQRSKLLYVHDCKLRPEEKITTILNPDSVHRIHNKLLQLNIDALRSAADNSKDEDEWIDYKLSSELEPLRNFFAEIVIAKGGFVGWN